MRYGTCSTVASTCLILPSITLNDSKIRKLIGREKTPCGV